jgi:hypothetical protein
MAGPGPYPAFLTETGYLTGVVKIGINSFHDGSLNFGTSGIPPLDELFFTDTGTYPVNFPLSTTVPVSATGSFPINFSFHSESWGRVGVTSGDFAHTLEVTSLLLPSGETPESQGWTLSFDDGAGSPNAPVTPGVPEPASLTLLGIGTVGIIVYVWRRKNAVAC